MIQQITIDNFQCHKHIVLDLASTVTLIQGASDSGKTAIMRALYWTMFNTPGGDSFVSNWIKTDSGKIKAGCFTQVTVLVNGHEVIRRKDASFNGYLVDGTKYEALRGQVPCEVTKAFNIASASVQRQLDPPFLLSNTAGEAADYLNGLVHLSSISDILGIAKGEVKNAIAAYKAAEAEQIQIQTQLQGLNWVNSAEPLIAQATANETGMQAVSQTITKISETLQSYESVPKLPSVPVELIQAAQNAAATIQLKAAIVTKTLNDLNQFEALKLPDVPADLCEAAAQTASQLDAAKKTVDSLNGSLLAFSQIPSLPDVPSDLTSAAVQAQQDMLGLNKLISAAGNFCQAADLAAKLQAAEAALAAVQAIAKPADATATANAVAYTTDSLQAADCLANSIVAQNAEIQQLQTALQGQVCPVCGQAWHA